MKFCKPNLPGNPTALLNVLYGTGISINIEDQYEQYFCKDSARYVYRWPRQFAGSLLSDVITHPGSPVLGQPRSLTAYYRDLFINI